MNLTDIILTEEPFKVGGAGLWKDKVKPHVAVQLQCALNLIGEWLCPIQPTLLGRSKFLNLDRELS